MQRFNPRHFLGFTRTFGLYAVMTTHLLNPSAAEARLARLAVHPDGHYLVKETGEPFFWLGDTGWKLLQSTTEEEAFYYLRTRAHQGFTIIQTMVLAENESVTVPNALGQLAFVAEDPQQPNEAFFDHIATVVAEADRLGLYVALVPTWGDKLTAPWGVGPRIFRLDNLPVAEAYGHFLGERFRAFTNIVWVIGGDRPAKLAGLENDFLQDIAREAGFPPDQDWTPIWTAMVTGLTRGGGRDPLCIYHPQGGPYSSSQQVPEVAWIDLHGMQSGHGGGHDVPVWDWIARDFALSPAKPTIDIEPNYEDHPYNPWPAWDPATGWFRDHDVRKQCYRGVFAGAAGVTYGHHAVWQFASRRNGVINFAERDWVDALHRPAANQLRHLRTLLESRPYLTRLPAPEAIIRQPGVDRRVHCVATRDEEYSYLWVYFPDHDLTAEIDLKRLPAPSVEAWWYDPRTGFSRPLGLISTDQTQAFKSPPFGPDWVLMLEDPKAGYTRPGI